MEDLKAYPCCFFGHRKISEIEEMKKKVYDAVKVLIVEEKVHTFLFGSKSQFDDLCHDVVTKLKEEYSYIKRVYVRAEFPYIDDSYRNYLLKSYDDTYYPEKILGAGKAIYIERNYYMIDKSKFCIAYYDENYSPPRRRNGKRDLLDYQPKSGTKLAYDYAVKKGLIINNVAAVCR